MSKNNHHLNCCSCHDMCHEHKHLPSNEEHIECGCGHSHHKKSFGDLVLFAVGIVFFVLSFALSNANAITVLKIISIVFCGYKILYRGIVSVLKIKFDENTLMAVASVACIIMGDLSEALIIAVLFGVGEYLEEYAVEKSHKRIENLIDQSEDVAYDENGKKTDPKSIKKGDKLLLRAGDKLCVDAKILSGNTSFDTSNLTGESIPHDKKTGDMVLAGFVNIGNAIVCVATSDYSNSTSAKIKEYVHNAKNQKASTEKFITKFAKIYTPAVIGIAICMGLLLTLFGICNISESIKRALTFMIASCPCALVISIPLCYFGAIGCASKYGVLIKGSKHINTLKNADAVAFDKTGTLTEGKLKISQIKILGDKTEEELLNYANALEIHSSHPIAKAICESAPQKTYKAENVKEHFGMGIHGIVNGHMVSLGNNNLISYMDLKEKNGLVLCIDEKAECVIELSDTIKSDAKRTVEQLTELGVKNAYILSGDLDSEVKKVANAIGNIQGFGQLLPKEKADKLMELKQYHKAIIYVGDGVNDAPCLSASDFSISIGTGSSLALETGDATLISSSLKSIVSAIKLASYTVKVVYTNIFFSLGVKFIVLILAALGIAPIWFGLFADVGVLVIAILNSLSILYKKF